METFIFEPVLDSKITYEWRHRFSACIMLVALLWLTASLPFVNAAKNAFSSVMQMTNTMPDEECGNSFAGATEEKTHNSGNTLSEYLHERHIIEDASDVFIDYAKCHPSDLYFAFHPELNSPPPEDIPA